MSEEKRLPFVGYVTPSKSPKEGRVSARSSKLSTVRSCSSPNGLRAVHADKKLGARGSLQVDVEWLQGITDNYQQCLRVLLKTV